ncbi:MAG: hypothetical protein ACYTG0_03205, partial [Planctomycetota bacterium]
MIYKRLLGEIEWVARRFRRLYLWRGLAVGWLAAAAVGAGLLLLGWGGWSPFWWAPAVCCIGVVAGAAASSRALRSIRDPRWVARQVEAEYPELDSLLLAAVEQQPTLPDGQFGFLQENVIRGALDHGRKHDWESAVSERRIRIARLAGWTGLVMLGVVCGALATYGTKRPSTAETSPGSEPLPADRRYEVTVAPGDAQIERGTSLIVTAAFGADVPDDAALVFQTASGETTRLAMSLSLSDPVFGGRVANVQEDLEYHVEYAEQATRPNRVTVFEFPRLERADVELAFPEYTGLAEKRVEDTRRVTAVEGTELTLFCRLNKQVAKADLVDEEGSRIELAAEGGKSQIYRVDHTLRASARYRLELVDAAGRKNKTPPELVFNVTPNRPADVKLAAPARDVRVSPIEELLAKASVWDDFGLPSYGLTFQTPGSGSQEVVLGQSTRRNRRLDVEHLIDFEALQAEPDQLLAYYFWAEDVGPDGKPRRSLGDMYFAEVRHFEEIFRQGEQPPGGSSQQQQQQQQQGQGNANEAEQLAELQKQIINATWTVIRREVATPPTDDFLPDTQQLQQSQQAALDQTTALAEKLQDPESQEHVQRVLEHMTAALTHLGEAAGSNSPEPLHPALAAEQAAYQALLKLRAREFQVTRQRRQQSQQQRKQSASGPQSRMQKQLQELQLKESENRYETQRTAEAQQEQAERETRQVLNRLRELARRQADLNERLKELQSALEEAETEEEREEIRRRLKRLREQEQEILRDTDDLRQRMQQPENQERMAESRSNLDQTREQIRQTTEALQQGQVSRAVASGTRAERQLKQMREEFRRQASDRFTEEVEQLRDDARKLAENETELSEKLQDSDQPEAQSGRLRDPERREDLGDAFRQQREDLDQLLDDMKQTIEEAEEAEPLMADHLYDALRKARQQRVDDALDATRSMLDRGFLDQARLAESQAGKGIEELKEGVEKAAESVLGDEDEALRRAHELLEGLSDDLNEEIRRADPRQAPPDRLAARKEPGEPSSEPEDDSRRRPGQPTEGDRPSDAERKPQPSEGDGQRRPGQQPSDRADESRQNEPGRRPGPRSLREPRPGERPGGGGPAERKPRPSREERLQEPIAGDDYAEWSDRLRD